MKKALIISGGMVDDYEYVLGRIAGFDYTICCDGGVYHAKAMKLTPDLIVGDFDSSDYALFPGVKKIKFEREKDKTDTQIAVEHALSEGFKSIAIIGALGGRLDHELANVGLLELLLKNGGYGALVSRKNIAYLADSAHPFAMNLKEFRNQGYNLSIIALGEQARGVTTTGLGYALNKSTIEFGSTIGISNTIVSDNVCITIDSGKLFILLSID